ncbi:MAG: TolC family protein [candidate division WOR-3 bacterium]|nr:TolC family protein [candidate division WOR-3 bacterium]MDW8113793.1 TolC family protein [candidate division WOR-3 bacterium]
MINLILFFLILTDTLYISLKEAKEYAKKFSVYKEEADYYNKTGINNILGITSELLPQTNLSFSYSETREPKRNFYRGSFVMSGKIFDIENYLNLIFINKSFNFYNLGKKERLEYLDYLCENAYFNLLRFYNIYQVKKNLLTYKEEYKNLIEEKYKLGQVNKIDYLRAKTDYALASQQLLSSEKNFKQAIMSLKIILGIKEDKIILPKTEIPELKNEFLNEIKKINEEDVDRILKENLNLKKATIQKTLAKVSYASAILRIFPICQLSYSSTYSDSERFYFNLKDWDKRDNISFSLSFSFPIFDFKNYLLNINNKKLQMKKSKIDERKTYEEILKSTIDALNSLKEAIEKYEYGKTNLEMAEELYLLAKEQLKVGRISYLDFMNIENTYNEAKSNYISSLCDIYITLSLLKYLGLKDLKMEVE